MSNICREEVLERAGNVILHSKLHDTTKEELETAKQEYLTAGKCSHNYVKDTPGFYYDSRDCAICGKGLGLV